MNLNWFTNGNRGVSTRLNKRCKDDFDHNIHTQYQNGYENEKQYEEIKNGFCGDVKDEIHQGSKKRMYGLPYMSRNFRNMLHETAINMNKQKYEKEYKAYKLLDQLNTQRTLQEADIANQLKALEGAYNANITKHTPEVDTDYYIDLRAQTTKKYKQDIEQIKNDKKRKEFITQNDVDNREIITHTSMGGSRRRRLRRSRRTGGLRRRSRRN